MINVWRRRSVDICFRDAAARKIHDAANEASPSETGGLVLGWWDKNTIMVEDVVVVEDPNATTSSWVRHEVKAQQKLDDARSSDRAEFVGYVGDWHCHPANIGASSTDISSLKQSSRQYELPVVLIVRKPKDQLEFHVACRGKLYKANLVAR